MYRCSERCLFVCTLASNKLLSFIMWFFAQKAFFVIASNKLQSEKAFDFCHFATEFHEESAFECGYKMSCAQTATKIVSVLLFRLFISFQLLFIALCCASSWLRCWFCEAEQWIMCAPLSQSRLKTVFRKTQHSTQRTRKEGHNNHKMNKFIWRQQQQQRSDNQNEMKYKMKEKKHEQRHRRHEEKLNSIFKTTQNLFTTVRIMLHCFTLLYAINNVTLVPVPSAYITHIYTILLVFRFHK